MVNVRAKQYRIALWTRTAANEAVQVAIAKQIKEVLQLPENAKIGFMAHVGWGWSVLYEWRRGWWWRCLVGVCAAWSLCDAILLSHL